MNDIDIYECSLKIRKAIEEEVKEGGRFDCFCENLAGLCAIGSSCLVSHLKLKGVDADVFKGFFRGKHEHCWAETSEHVIDITTTQFWGMKEHIFKLSKNGRMYRDLYCFGFPVYRIEAFNDWPEEQRPDKEKIDFILRKVEEDDRSSWREDEDLRVGNEGFAHQSTSCYC